MWGNSHPYSLREVKLRSFQDRLLSQSQNQNPQWYNEQDPWQLCYLYFNYAWFALNAQLHRYIFLLLEHQGSHGTLYRHSLRTPTPSPSAVAPHSLTCLHIPWFPTNTPGPRRGRASPPLNNPSCLPHHRVTLFLALIFNVWLTEEAYDFITPGKRVEIRMWKQGWFQVAVVA